MFARLFVCLLASWVNGMLVATKGNNEEMIRNNEETIVFFRYLY